jgi:hypothetical protein
VDSASIVSQSIKLLLECLGLRQRLQVDNWRISGWFSGLTGIESGRESQKRMESTSKDFGAAVKANFERMCSAALGDDDQELFRLYDSGKHSGVDFTITGTQSTAFKEDGGLSYTEVTQELTLRLGGVSVAEWTQTYWGYYGGMGAGWWVEEGDNTLSQSGVAELIEKLELEIPRPDVPQPTFPSDEEDSE